MNNETKKITQEVTLQFTEKSKRSHRPKNQSMITKNNGTQVDVTATMHFHWKWSKEETAPRKPRKVTGHEAHVHA
jgi:hypothetical protein